MAVEYPGSPKSETRNGRILSWLLLAALLGGGPALLGAVAAVSSADAHDAKRHGVAETRVELSFDRTADYDYDPPEPGSYVLPVLKPAADGNVLGPDGRALTLHQLMDGRITVLAFIYTRCSDPKGCPLSTALLYDLQYVGERDPVIGNSLRLIAVSFDPEYDTPEVIGRYGGEVRPGGDQDAGLMFLTTRSLAELRPILDAYDQPIGPKSEPDDPFGPFNHQLRVYLVDRQARIRNIYSLGFLDPRLVVTDIRTLLLEGREEVRGG